MSEENVKLHQKFLVEKGFEVPVTGKFDQNTLDCSRTYYISGANNSSKELLGTSNKFKEVFSQTPNISSKSISPLGIVLHHSCGGYAGTVDWCKTPSPKNPNPVSYHCVINTDGNRTVLALDTQRAWHAGKSNFLGTSDVNGIMIGLAFTGDTNNRVLSNSEIESACEYIIPRIKKHGWAKDLSTITTHRHISPGRKDDVDIRAETAIKNALKKYL